jgi:hypothetical protein
LADELSKLTSSNNPMQEKLNKLEDKLKKQKALINEKVGFFVENV